LRKKRRGRGGLSLEREVDWEEYIKWFTEWSKYSQVKEYAD